MRKDISFCRLGYFFDIKITFFVFRFFRIFVSGFFRFGVRLLNVAARHPVQSFSHSRKRQTQFLTRPRTFGTDSPRCNRMQQKSIERHMYFRPPPSKCLNVFFFVIINSIFISLIFLLCF